MRNLLNDHDRSEILARVKRLRDGAPGLWGRMNVNEMVCHLSDTFLVALGDTRAADGSNLAKRTLLKWMVLAGVPAPKGKVKTFPEIDQAEGRGTRPTALAPDVEALDQLVQRFVAHGAGGGAYERSPAFGRMSNRQWGRLMWVHMNHHLKQFGV